MVSRSRRRKTAKGLSRTANRNAVASFKPERHQARHSCRIQNQTMFQDPSGAEYGLWVGRRCSVAQIKRRRSNAALPEYATPTKDEDSYGAGLRPTGFLPLRHRTAGDPSGRPRRLKIESTRDAVHVQQFAREK